MRLSSLFKAAVACAVMTAGTAFAGTFYTTEASFQAQIAANPYVENFNNFTFGSPLNGSQTTWPAPGANGFGWTAAAPGGLWSNNSALSTNLAFDPITITFTGAPVTALGGNFTNTDINGNVIAGTVTVLLSNGDTQSVTNQNLSSFLGYTSDSGPIASVTISTPQAATNGWVQVDHFYSAQLIPEPATLSVVAGALGLLALRRRK